MDNSCEHKNIQKLRLEHCYGFLAEIMEHCKDCGKVMSSKWYQSNNCGETWVPCKNPMDDFL